MLHSENAVLKLNKEVQTVSGKFDGLVSDYLKRSYSDARAREHAEHGFSRRMGILVRCINVVFQILPPDRVEFPTSKELSDVNINLQAFIFNVFGCVDNLAWILVLENKIKRQNGNPLEDKLVGLRKHNKFLRIKVSAEFSKYLEGLDKWFAYLSDFRHAVAHRIPLYVPPYTVVMSKLPAYRELEIQKLGALQRGALDEYDRFLKEQKALGEFSPIMTHSFEENSKQVIFHSQLLADFNTIEELGRMVLEELDR